MKKETMKLTRLYNKLDNEREWADMLAQYIKELKFKYDAESIMNLEYLLDEAIEVLNAIEKIKIEIEIERENSIYYCFKNSAIKSERICISAGLNINHGKMMF